MFTRMVGCTFTENKKKVQIWREKNMSDFLVPDLDLFFTRVVRYTLVHHCIVSFRMENYNVFERRRLSCPLGRWGPFLSVEFAIAQVTNPVSGTECYRN